MKTFSDRWRQLDWDDIRLRINGKTAVDVERALNASQFTRDDMMALLSPAASGYLEQLAQRAQRLTRQRFGNTVSFYVKHNYFSFLFFNTFNVGIIGTHCKIARNVM